MVTAVTPILVVDDIEPCIPFWVDRLGFQAVATVPESEGTDKLGFAMLTSGDITVMYQTRESIRADLPSVLSGGGQVQYLFVTVEDLDDVMKRMEGIDALVPERTTFYGMREYGVREPAGNPIVFAQQIAQE